MFQGFYQSKCVNKCKNYNSKTAALKLIAVALEIRAAQGNRLFVSRNGNKFEEVANSGIPMYVFKMFSYVYCQNAVV